MSWYPVHRPATARTSLVRLVAVACVATALLVVSFRTFPVVPVKVNGVRVNVRAGTSVADALRAAEGTLATGDLLSAKDGRVVRRGGGDAPVVLVNGREESIATRVYAGDALTSSPGRDAVESIVASSLAIAIPVRVEGRGPLVQLAQPGAVGLARLRVGEVSGDVVASETIRPAVAMVYRRLAPSGRGKYVALTFDDGPWPGQTERILAILKRENVKATFFMVGLRVRRAPAIARQIAADGHLLGNHTEHHLNLRNAKTLWQAEREIGRAQQTIKRATGVVCRWFRPPGGATNRFVYEASGKLELRLAMWNVDPQDWRKPGSGAIVARVTSAVRPGCVVLLHDGGGDRHQTVWALPKIIRELKAEGYTFVRLDELPTTVGWRR